MVARNDDKALMEALDKFGPLPVAMYEAFVIQVIDAPVSNSQEKVCPPTLAVSLGLILSPLKGVIRSKNLFTSEKKLRG